MDAESLKRKREKERMMNELKRKQSRMPPPIDDFHSLMAKAEQNRKKDQKKIEKEYLAPPKKLQKIEVPKKKIELGITAGKTLNYSGIKKKEEINTGHLSNGKTSTTPTIKAKPTDPELDVLKRYLPGDARNTNQMLANTSKPKPQPTSKQINNSNNLHTSKVLNSSSKLNEQNSKNSLKERSTSISNSNRIEKKTTNNETAALEKRLREMDAEALKIKREKERMINELKRKQSRLPPPVDDFHSLMAKAEQNLKTDPKKIEKEYLAPPKKIPKLEAPKKKVEVGLTAGKTLNYSGIKKKEEITTGHLSNGKTSTTPAIKAAVVQQPKIDVPKRYLPGDVRNKTQMTASTSKPKPQTTSKQVNNLNNLQTSKLSNSSKMNGQNTNSSLRNINNPSTSKSFSNQNGKKSVNSETAALERRLREMEAENLKNKREKEELLKELKRKEAAINQKHLKTVHRTENRSAEESINKIKQEQMRKFEMRMNLKQQNRNSELEKRKHAAKILGRKNDSNRPNPFANYSETDEDSDNSGRPRRFYRDDDEEEEDDEYDSELDDFIDDSLDDGVVSREMIEESLKYDFRSQIKLVFFRAVNQRYDRKKYAIMDRMPMGCMTARFSDIEKEERRSAKIAYLDDLREAQRGSRAL